MQTFRSFNQLISNHLKDFIHDDIQTINFLPSPLYYMILSRSRSPKRRHQDKTASSLLFFFGHGRMRASARSQRAASPRETRDDWYIFRTVLRGVLVLVIYYLQYYSIILIASLAFFSLNTVPFLFFWNYRQHWRWVK